jgi:hypothetical protein
MADFCISILKHVPAIQNTIADSIVGVVVLLFLTVIVFSTAFYLIIYWKLRDNFPYMFKPIPAVILCLSTFMSLFSVYITYGFLVDDFSGEILQATCSLMTFWLQFVFGISMWISLLFSQILGTAINVIPSFNNTFTSDNQKLLVKLSIIFLFLIFFITVGIIGHVLGLFSNEEGHCSTHISIKIINIIVITLSIIAIVVLTKIMSKTNILSQEDIQKLSIENSIVKKTWLSFIILVLFNLTSITAYWFGRMVFIFVLMFMYSYTFLVYIFVPILHHKGFNISTWFPAIYIKSMAYSSLQDREQEDEENPEERLSTSDSLPQVYSSPMINKYNLKDNYIREDANAETLFKSLKDMLNEEQHGDMMVTIPKRSGERININARKLVDFIIDLRTNMIGLEIGEFMDQTRYINQLKASFMLIDNISSSSMMQIDTSLTQLINYDNISEIIANINPNADITILLSMIKPFYNRLKASIIECLFDIWLEYGYYNSFIEAQALSKQVANSLGNDSGLV